MLRQSLEKVLTGQHLDREEARRTVLAMLSGEAHDSVIGALLAALKLNGETAGEITGFAEGMRAAKVGISPRVSPLVDTCGTGGDGKGTFNISTTSAIIAAASGVCVAKHGNRGVSSGCGSADVLEALGVNIEMTPAAVERCIEEVGLGFMFAPAFHPAMKLVMPARKALGLPTIFNVLGPLTNPAGAGAQVVGVNRPELVMTVGEVLRDLGCEHGFVLHGRDGMDEFTVTTSTSVCEVRAGRLMLYELAPEDLSLERCGVGALSGGTAIENARITREVLAGAPGGRLDVCLANAAFALVAGGACASLAEAVSTARRAVESGRAVSLLKRLIDFGQRGGNRVP